MIKTIIKGVLTILVLAAAIPAGRNLVAHNQVGWA